MSIGEILVILLVAIVVTKPKDIPIIIDKIKSLLAFFRKFKADIFSHLENELDLQDKSTQAQFEQTDRINFYLEKIIQIEGKYEGEYDLDSVRDKYFALNQDVSQLKNKN